ncbi:hypothetical protein ALP75_205163 [Pseudomonas syringae pv. actinidiae]|nr:hypothetical protein ALP75_205163 [Pseudomonas syringae pv. actinidiae]
MKIDARWLVGSLVSLCMTCKVRGWLFSSPSCNDGMITLPVSRGSNVTIQRVVA